MIRLYNRMSTGAAIMDSARARVRLRPGRHGICQFGEAARRLDRLLRRASRGSFATRSLDHGIIVHQAPTSFGRRQAIYSTMPAR
jgi:hypothetical protein